MAERGAGVGDGRDDPAVPVIPKVVVYLTRRHPTTGEPQLLVFDHVDAPEAGTQVPAGTIDAGEDVVAAAVREVVEETGLDGIVVAAELGTADVDLRAYGIDAVARRHFVHAVVDTVDPGRGERWHHVERHRSDGGPPVTFALYWAPLGSPPPLAGGLGARLSMLRRGHV